MKSVLFGVLVVAAPVLPATAIEEAEIANAGARYQKNCMGCHQPPDLRFASDRAWIDQIRRTA